MAEPALETPEANEEGTKVPYSDKQVLDLAWAEWDTIQKKIDSVSSFTFQVKTWSVTLSGGLFVLLSRVPDAPRYSLLSLLLLPLAFRAVESNAIRLRENLSRRAKTLENVMEALAPVRDILPADFPSNLLRELGRFPGIGLAISRDLTKLTKQKIAFETPMKKHPPDWAFENWVHVWHKFVARYSDMYFFFGQLLVLALIIIPFEFKRANQIDKANEEGSRRGVQAEEKFLSPL